MPAPRRARPSAGVPPMKARDLGGLVEWGADEPFAALAPYLTDRYAMEPKLDGVRVQLSIGPGGSRVATANLAGGADRTANFPHLARLTHPDLVGCVLDGELISPTPRIRGRSGWTNSLLNASAVLATSGPATSIALQRQHGVAQLWAFDLLAGPGGVDLKRQPYDVRREALQLVVERLGQLGSARSAESLGDRRSAEEPASRPGSGPGNRRRGPVYLVEQLEASAASIAAALEAGFEGVVIKRRSAAYAPGSRRGEWMKIKRLSTADGYIVGFTPGENGWRGQVGSLELALRRPDGTDQLVASVGVPLAAMRAAMSDEDGSLRSEWYGRVVEFCAQGITSGGRARHPRLLRLRPDKTAEDCGVDQLESFARM